MFDIYNIYHKNLNWCYNYDSSTRTFGVHCLGDAGLGCVSFALPESAICSVPGTRHTVVVPLIIIVSVGTLVAPIPSGSCCVACTNTIIHNQWTPSPYSLVYTFTYGSDCFFAKRFTIDWVKVTAISGDLKNT